MSSYKTLNELISTTSSVDLKVRLNEVKDVTMESTINNLTEVLINLNGSCKIFKAEQHNLAEKINQMEDKIEILKSYLQELNSNLSKKEI